MPSDRDWPAADVYATTNVDAVANVDVIANVNAAAKIVAPRELGAAPEVIPRLNGGPPTHIGTRCGVALHANVLAREALRMTAGRR